MDTIPTEIFAYLCSHLQPRVLGILSRCSKALNMLVKSDAVLHYHKTALLKRWNFTLKVQQLKGSIYERIKMRLEAQKRWNQFSTPSGYILPSAGDKISTILYKKNRLLVLSVTDAKNTKISMFDLETLKILATTETNKFRGNPKETKILWKGGDWVLFCGDGALYGWNSAENSIDQVPLSGTKFSMVNFKTVAFDGVETVFYMTSLVYIAAVDDDRFDRYIYNLRTKETRKIDWIQSNNALLMVNWRNRIVVYQAQDQKYYLEKFDSNWVRTKSIVLDVMDCYGAVSFMFVADYIIVVYDAQSTSPRLFSAHTGAIVMRLPFRIMPSIQKLKCSQDGFLTLSFQHSNAISGAYSLKDNRLDQLAWITKLVLAGGERSVLKIFSPELALINKSICFQTPTLKTDIVSGGKLTASFARRIPAEYEKWHVMNSVASETQLILQMQTQNTKQTVLIVLDFCNSVVA